MNASISTSTLKTTSRKYHRRSESQWRELINTFAESGLTLSAYCQQHDIAPSGFYAWRKRFATALEKSTPVEALVDITPQLNIPASSIPSDNTLWQVEVELGRGCVLRIKTA